MKKLFLASALALFGAINAQVKYSFKLGYVNSTLPISYLNYSNTAASKSNVYLGIGVENKFNKNFAVEGDLLIAGLGGTVPLSFDGQTLQNMKLHLGTILIPVSLKYYPVDKFSMFAGLNFGFIINSTGEINGEKGKIEDIKTLNFGPHFGAEFNISNKFSIEGRYNIGLSNLAKTDATTAGLEMKNNFLQIGIGYKY